jgi:hypothetical protein
LDAGASRECGEGIKNLQRERLRVSAGSIALHQVLKLNAISSWSSDHIVIGLLGIPHSDLLSWPLRDGGPSLAMFGSVESLPVTFLMNLSNQTLSKHDVNDGRQNRDSLGLTKCSPRMSAITRSSPNSRPAENGPFPVAAQCRVWSTHHALANVAKGPKRAFGW